MEEALINSKEELKRVDHLIYVSLKYTRTCDIFKSIIERLISSLDFSIEALLKNLETERKIMEIPAQPGLKCSLIKQNYGGIPEIIEIIDFYLLLRQMSRAEFEREREFRRHVTMRINVGGEEMEVNIDNITEFFKRTRNYNEFIEKMLIKPKEK